MHCHDRGMLEQEDSYLWSRDQNEWRSGWGFFHFFILNSFTIILCFLLFLSIFIYTVCPSFSFLYFCVPFFCIPLFDLVHFSLFINWSVNFLCMVFFGPFFSILYVLVHYLCFSFFFGPFSVSWISLLYRPLIILFFCLFVGPECLDLDMAFFKL